MRLPWSWSLDNLSYLLLTYFRLIRLFWYSCFNLYISDFGAGQFMSGGKELLLLIERAINVIATWAYLIKVCLCGAPELFLTAEAVMFR